MIEIATSELSAGIDPAGAQLSFLRDREGQDLLWNGDPRFWKGRAPILFPVVGALQGGRYRHAGQDYALPRHGFARDRIFDVLEQGPSSAVLRLTADKESRAIYPFEFVLDLEFRISQATLSVRARIGNRGESEMPASFGFHPGFCWPLPYGERREQHRIVFSHAEHDTVRRLDARGTLLPDPQPSPLAGNVLTLTDSVFEADALIFSPVRSNMVIYRAESGPRLEITFEGMTSLGIWSKPGAPFVCIEPWHGLADPQGYRGDIIDKPEIMRLGPGEVRHCRMDVNLEIR